MSNDIAWQVIRNNSCFLRRQRGINKHFSTEPLNLKATNSKLYSGLVGRRAVGVTLSADGKNVVVSHKKLGSRKNPAKSVVSTTVKKGARGTVKSVRNFVKSVNPRFSKLAARRASQLVRAIKRSNKKTA